MHQSVVPMVIVAVLVASCGSPQADESGAVTAGTVTQLEQVLKARAQAMGKGDRDAFLKTIDATRPAFRRVQLTHFEFPSARGGLGSTFKLSGIERYRGYVRGFAEETLEGNQFPGAFVVPSYSRYYFRSDGGRWIVTEPTGDETGPEKQRTADGVELSYWALDEDLASVYLLEMQEARRQALTHSPRPQQMKLRIAFIPTAELAGPAWDGHAMNGGSIAARQSIYPQHSFDQSRSHLSPLAQNNLLYMALNVVREGIAPGAASRLSLTRWLDAGWLEHASGIDVTPTLKQSCVGVPVPTLKQMDEGPPPFGTPGVAPEVYGRNSAYAASMVDFLIERYGSAALWETTALFVTDASAARNFQKVLKTTPDDFYAAWLVWLKKKYC